MIGKIDLLDREKSGFVEKEIFQNIPLVKENGNSCIIQINSEDSLKKFYLFKDGIYFFSNLRIVLFFSDYNEK